MLSCAIIEMLTDKAHATIVQITTPLTQPANGCKNTEGANASPSQGNPRVLISIWSWHTTTWWRFVKHAIILSAETRMNIWVKKALCLWHINKHNHTTRITQNIVIDLIYYSVCEYALLPCDGVSDLCLDSVNIMARLTASDHRLEFFTSTHQVFFSFLKLIKHMLITWKMIA